MSNIRNFWQAPMSLECTIHLVNGSGLELREVLPCYLQLHEEGEMKFHVIGYESHFEKSSIKTRLN